jgi:hypothetical protein
MVNVTFTEYLWDSATYTYVLSGRSYTLEFNPKSIKVSRDVNWRQKHSGTRRKQKTRYRPREKISITIAGMAVGQKELHALQRIANYNSKWKITNLQFEFPQLSTTAELDWTGSETIYFVCTKLQFDRKTGKDQVERPSDQVDSLVYDYTMTFEMVRDPPEK